MIVLEHKYKIQIENTIGRQLSSDELAERMALSQLSEAQLALGRLLEGKQLVLCLKYLQGVVPELDQRTAVRFIDEVLHFGSSTAT